MTILIERLRGLPVDSLAALIAESEQAGLRFVRRLVEEWGTGANRFDRSGEALFAARVDGELVGVCGLNIDPYAANDRIGRLRHLYVRSAFRRRGGRSFVASCCPCRCDAPSSDGRSKCDHTVASGSTIGPGAAISVPWPGSV